MLSIDGLSFFQPTPDLRELILLMEIAKCPKLSQAKMATSAGIRPSMANGYLKQFVRRGLMRKGDGNHKNMSYHLTAEGEARRVDLLWKYLNETVGLYKRSKDEFVEAVRRLKDTGFTRLVLYGAGDTGELVVAVAEKLQMVILGIVDSDPRKQGTLFCGRTVLEPSKILPLNPQAVLVTSLGYGHQIAASLGYLEAAGVRVETLKV
ncbi:MAG: hypothetical protein HYX75_04905 [Acidobacteria bacterium]|nr:hypothetical protein [Acidobacteriota bacterium]